MRYKWNVGAILRTTKNIDLIDGNLIPKHSIVKIKKRRNGYHAMRLIPPKFQFITRLCDNFEEVPREQWDSLFLQVGDFADCDYASFL